MLCIYWRTSYWSMSYSGAFYCSDALSGSWFCHRIIQSWVTISSDSALEWTVGAGNKHFPIWMTSCAAGLDCGICQPSTPPCSVTPSTSPLLSLYESTSTSSTQALPLPPSSPSFCPLAHPPPWLRPESHNVSLDLLVNPPSPQASRVPSHLPLLPLPSFNHPLAVPPTHQFLLITLTPSLPLGPNSGCPWVGAKARKEREGLVVVGRAAVNWEDLHWKLHQWLNHSQLRFTEKHKAGHALLAPEYLSFCPILISLHLHPSDQIWHSGKSFIQSLHWGEWCCFGLYFFFIHLKHGNLWDVLTLLIIKKTIMSHIVLLW